MQTSVQDGIAKALIVGPDKVVTSKPQFGCHLQMDTFEGAAERNIRPTVAFIDYKGTSVGCSTEFFTATLRAVRWSACVDLLDGNEYKIPELLERYGK